MTAPFRKTAAHPQAVEAGLLRLGRWEQWRLPVLEFFVVLEIPVERVIEFGSQEAVLS